MMKKALLLLFVFIFMSSIVNARLENYQDSQINVAGKNYYQSYTANFYPNSTTRAFVWHIVNIEKPAYPGINRVFITSNSASYIYECGNGGCSQKTITSNGTDLDLTADDLAYSVAKTYVIAELVSSYVNYSGNPPYATSSVQVLTFYDDAVTAYSPVRVQSFVATDGTDVCSIIQEANNAQLEFDGGTIFRYAVQIATMNIELIKTMFWLFKILIFMVALGALFYLFLIIVKLIKGGRP